MKEIVDIHHDGTNCQVSIKDQKNIEGLKEKFLVITDSETGLVKLGSKLSFKEYNHFKKNGELDLFEDPQRLAMNKKSVAEADALKRAKKQGLLDDWIVRRPHNTTETLADFIGENIIDGIQVEIDVKAIEGSDKRSFRTQIEDIIDSINKDFENSKDPLNLIPICDLADTPNFLKRDIYEALRNQLNQTEFLFDSKFFNN